MEEACPALPLLVDKAWKNILKIAYVSMWVLIIINHKILGVLICSNWTKYKIPAYMHVHRKQLHVFWLQNKINDEPSQRFTFSPSINYLPVCDVRKMEVFSLITHPTHHLYTLVRLLKSWSFNKQVCDFWIHETADGYSWTLISSFKNWTVVLST